MSKYIGLTFILSSIYNTLNMPSLEYTELIVVYNGMSLICALFGVIFILISVLMVRKRG